MFFLEFELETCLNNAESVLVEARVVALAGTYDMTAHTPDHILVDVVVHGKSPVAELATMETSLRSVDVSVVVCSSKLQNDIPQNLFCSRRADLEPYKLKVRADAGS